MSEIVAGQIYREKDKRFVRHVVVVDPLPDGRYRCAPCREDGARMFGGRITKIRADSLRKRFTLVGTR